MDLSIVIVNFNTCNDTLKCIESIKTNTYEISYEIILVDNQSSDSSLEIISKEHSDVKCIQSGYNAGFARANNMGIKESNGEFVLLLNSDTELIGNALKETVSRMKLDPKISAAGCQLLNSDGSLQFSGGPTETGVKWIYNIPYYGPVYQKIDRLFRPKEYMIQNHELYDVDWIIGAFMCVRRSVIEKIGDLDEDFFLYAEEIEWCNRFQKCGKLVLFRDIQVLHHMGVSSSEAFSEKRTEFILLDSKKERQRVLSLMLYLRKSFGWWVALVFHLHFSIALPIYFWGRILSNIVKLKWPWTKLNECFAYWKNLWIWRKYLFIMMSKKAYFYKTL